MAYWLIKTEPTDYSFSDLLRDRKAAWTGVKNPLARRHLREMRKGDSILVYHTGDEKAVVGLGRVSAGDEVKGEPEIAAEKALQRPVSLKEIKADGRFKGWGLVKIGRLSVVPTTKEEFEAVLALSKKLDKGE